MACSPQPASEPTPSVMTRCECADLPFDEIAAQIRGGGLSLDELGRRTGCGQTCTACLPDLQAYLASRRSR